MGISPLQIKCQWQKALGRKGSNLDLESGESFVPLSTQKLDLVRSEKELADINAFRTKLPEPSVHLKKAARMLKRSVVQLPKPKRKPNKDLKSTDTEPKIDSEGLPLYRRSLALERSLEARDRDQMPSVVGMSNTLQLMQRALPTQVKTVKSNAQLRLNMVAPKPTEIDADQGQEYLGFLKFKREKLAEFEK